MQWVWQRIRVGFSMGRPVCANHKLLGKKTRLIKPHVPSEGQGKKKAFISFCTTCIYS